MPSLERYRHYRRLLWAGALLYPAWLPILQHAAPGSDPGVARRLAVAALCIALALATHVSAAVRRHIELLFTAVAVLTVADVAFEAHVNGLSPPYAIAVLIVVFALTMCFDALPALAVYYAAALAAAALVQPGPGGVDKGYFMASVAATALFGFLACRDKLATLRALRESEARARAVIDAIPGPVSWVSRDLTYLGANPALAALHGRAPEDLVGRPLAEVTPEPEGTRRLLAELFAGDQPQLAREVATGAGADAASYLLSARKYRGGDEAVLVGIDITDRKRFEKELLDQREVVGQVVENLPLGLFAKNAADGFRFTMWNRRMEEITGIPRADILGKTDYDFFPKAEADHFRRTDESVMKGGVVVEIQEEPVTAGGRVIPAHTMKAPILDAMGRPLVLLGMLEDITEKKAREELIRDREMMLVHASKMTSLGEMSGGIAHEINNPLSIILGYAHVISRRLETPDYDRAEIIGIAARMMRTVERIARIVQGLRAFSREASGDPVECASLLRIAHDTLDLCHQRFNINGITVEVVGDEAVRAPCRPVQLSQVVLNLLHNAFDAVEERLAPRWVRIEVGAAADRAFLAVVDSGPGVPPEVQDKILQPFFTTKPVGKGTGLGLSISKGIVEVHGGRLFLDEASERTRFVVELPAAPA